MRAHLGVLVGSLVVALVPALPAAAQSLEGGCTVQATSSLDTTTVVDATRSDPFEIDPEGSVSWTATSPGPIKNHTWSIGVRIGTVTVTVAKGGDPNEGGSQSSTGSRTVSDLVESAKASGTPGAGLLRGLRGIYHVTGSIAGQGGACSGDGWVRIAGSPFSSPLGAAGAGVAVIGLLILALSGVAKRPG